MSPTPERYQEWLAFRERVKQGRREDRNMFVPYRNQKGRVEMPQLFGRDACKFREMQRVETLPELDWKTDHYRGTQRTNFTHEDFQVSVQVGFDEHWEYDFFGSFVSSPNVSSARRANWDQRRTNPPPPYLRGGSRQDWRQGISNRKYTHRLQRNQYEYAVLENYDYDDVRKAYWHMGYSKYEADLLARRAFEHDQLQLEEYGAGQRCIYTISVDVRLFPEDVVLGSSSIGGIEYETQDELKALVWEQIDEAKVAARSKIPERRTTLSNLLEKYDQWDKMTGSPDSPAGTP